MTAGEAWKKKDANEKKRKEALDKKRVTLIRITRNKIKNSLKACGVIIRKQEKERKKAVDILQNVGTTA
jgi:hypothetical protein